MLAVGDSYRAAKVAAIFLAHGTFVGPDALGLLRKLGRFHPASAVTLRGHIKAAVDHWIADNGNYTKEFAQQFEREINNDSRTHIPVRLFQWSSENHHIGRADGAVRLFDEVAEFTTSRKQSGGRLLFWGHSHGGNVFALLSNLLTADAKTREAFFTAASPYYRWPGFSRVDQPHWDRVRAQLADEDHEVRNWQFDFVTFGAPLRYGWSEGGYGNLAHFIHHRRTPNTPEYLSPYSGSIDDLLTAKYGDYVQLIGMAGADLGPALLAWRAWLANRRLSRIVQPPIRRRDFVRDYLARMKIGARCHDAGLNLLVDYGPQEGTIAQHHAGHAVYTRLQWLSFHAEQVARAFYDF